MALKEESSFDFVFRIEQEYHVLYARRKIREYTKSIGFQEHDIDKIELAISEIGTNIIKYAKTGSIGVRKISFQVATGIEIMARDKGGGIGNIIEKLERKPYPDSGESLGAGISAIYNLMDEFIVYPKDDVHREENRILIRKWIKIINHFKSSVISRPRLGEQDNGDTFFIKILPNFTVIAVVDALGHGKEAAMIARIVYNYLRVYYYLPLDEITHICHEALQGTRGSAISICKIHPAPKTLEYIGIGNVEFNVIGSEDLVRAYNYHGTLGMHLESVQIQKFPYRSSSTFIMTSDGIGDYRLDGTMLRKQPQDITSEILNQYGKKHDDATILLIR